MTSVLSYRKTVSIYLAWCLGWTGLQAFALVTTFDFAWRLALIDALITNLLIGAAGMVMITSMRYYQPGRAVRFASSVALAALCVVLMSTAAKNLGDTSTDYLEFFRRSLLIRGLYAWLMITLVAAVGWLTFIIVEQREIEKRKSETEKLAREAELLSIRQQLQPHFLFNSLNSISALAGSRPEKARKMIQQLSDFLRGTLKKEEQHLVPLTEELAQLELYLEIEKVRFGHRLITRLHISDDARAQKIPPLLLQPVVENAIKFGLYDTTGEAVISITANAMPTGLEIRVENPFDPETSKPRSGTGFGLSAVQRRLYLLFGRQDLVATRQRDTTFETVLLIPQPS